VAELWLFDHSHAQQVLYMVRRVVIARCWIWLCRGKRWWLWEPE